MRNYCAPRWQAPAKVQRHENCPTGNRWRTRVEYGGFETLAENLVKHHAHTGSASVLTVWCSSKDNATRPTSFQSANLRYVGLKANGVQSILYDVLGLLDAIRTGHNRILLLGVSGAMTLPLIRIFSRARIVTNIDGIEWKREKWNGLARAFLRASEWAAVRFSHEVIADNQAVAEHVRKIYGANCHVIAYGGDHALSHDSEGKTPEELPKGYALAICRIEPENNVHTILEAFSSLETPLVFVGNWGQQRLRTGTEGPLWCNVQSAHPGPDLRP